ncbi:hypothetical protein ACJJTC_007464 [Scirpophaga incertulas]
MIFVVSQFNEQAINGTANGDTGLPQGPIIDVHAHDILWLSCNSDPWEEVISKWKKIYELRKETEYENIFKHWPVLSDQRSDQLINIDFELMYPEKALNFYVNWDSFYENILKVRQTKDSSLSEVLIEEYHEKYLILFGNKLKPKNHFLIHYPNVIKKIGPPILISAFKYEAKHKELKQVCQSITSRKDLPLSVMKRYQLKQSFRHAIKKGLTDNLIFGKFEIDNYDEQDNNIKRSISVDWCEFNGIRQSEQWAAKLRVTLLFQFVKRPPQDGGGGCS